VLYDCGTKASSLHRKIQRQTEATLMRNPRMKWSCLLAVPLALMPLVPTMVFAQQPPPPPPPNGQAVVLLSRPELEQLLAPIALYPDELLTQTLVASTYPLEVVMASRWLQQGNNKDLRGDPLLQALDGQDWDPSVKSLIPFPVVLATMSDQLDWTQKLGDTFLAQQNDVFAAVQALRGRAQTAGTLQSNAQQVVTQEADVIVIAPAQPQVVYVPAYNPTVVYGAWPYASYPPVYYPPPPGYYMGTALMTGLAFGAGIAISSSLWGWGRPNWHGGNVNVNVNQFNSINSNRYNNFSPSRTVNNGGTWQHNADHRRGVAYSNPNVGQQYRPNGNNNAANRDAYKGRPAQGAGAGAAAGANRPNGGANQARPGAGGAANAQRPGGGNAGASRPQTPQNAQRPGGGNQGAGQSRPQGNTRPAPSGGSSALKGSNNGSAARAQSAQGHQSRGGGGGAAARPAPSKPAPAARPAPSGGGGQGRSGGGKNGGPRG